MADWLIVGRLTDMNNKTRVLVVDDELSYCEGLKVALGAEGFAVDVAADGEQALSILDAKNPDLVLLDVMMPRLSGLDVCRRIRAKSDVPVIMVSARKDEVDTVVGLEVGADDYIAKPYRLRELVARIRTVIRRAGIRQAQSEQVSELQVGDVVLDRDRHSVKVLGKEVELPLKEFELLALLMQHAGFVVTRQRLIDRVWGFDYVGNTKTLDVHIRRLRSRIESDPSEPELIVTIRGLGYKYVASQDH